MTPRATVAAAAATILLAGCAQSGRLKSVAMTAAPHLALMAARPSAEAAC